MEKLTRLRDQLDLLDQQISSLLNKRMYLVDKIAKYKSQHNVPVTDANREEEVLSHVKMAVDHPFLKESIVRIYKLVMEESKTSQRFFQYNLFPFRKLGIIAPPIILDSICRAIQMKDPSVSIATIQDEQTISEGHLLNVYSSLAELVDHSQCIIVANPLEIHELELINTAQNSCKKILIIQISSTCFNVNEDTVEDSKEFIYTHPILLKDQKLLSESSATYFDRTPWLIFPHHRNSPEALSETENFIYFLGGEPVYLQTNVEDRAIVLDQLDKWIK